MRFIWLAALDDVATFRSRRRHGLCRLVTVDPTHSSGAKHDQPWRCASVRELRREIAETRRALDRQLTRYVRACAVSIAGAASGLQAERCARATIYGGRAADRPGHPAEPRPSYHVADSACHGPWFHAISVAGIDRRLGRDLHRADRHQRRDRQIDPAIGGAFPACGSVAACRPARAPASCWRCTSAAPDARRGGCAPRRTPPRTPDRRRKALVALHERHQRQRHRRRARTPGAAR